jgi:hypothetical protein
MNSPSYSHRKNTEELQSGMSKKIRRENPVGNERGRHIGRVSTLR